MPARLTDPAINRAIRDAATLGARRDLADAGLPGLRLRVSPSGRGSWSLACRDPQGRMRRFTIGTWPALGLAKARESARALRIEVQRGADPVAERRRRRAEAEAAERGIGTLAALLDLYGGPLRPGAAPKPRVLGPGADLKSWPEARRRIESVFSAFLGRALATLKSADLQMAADQWPARQSAAAAVRYLRPVLKWGAKRGYLAAEVTTLQPPATVRRRERILSRAELAALLPVLRAPDAGPHAHAMLFILLTLCRREEAATARWQDVDLDRAEWTIPTTKSGRAHRLPLPRQAVALLRALGPGTPDAPVFANARGGRLGNWDRETKRIMHLSGTAGWTRHDLRRTGATLLGELGHHPHVIEAALNHATIHSTLAAVYNRARYAPAVREALQQLADHLDGIAAGAAEVVPLWQGRSR
jgi:integrase